MSVAAVITNRNKDSAGAVTAKVSSVLKNKYDIISIDGTDDVRTEEAIGKANVAIVLGGDGTILGVSRFAARHGVPIIGINLGTLGFLADVELAEIDGALNKFMNGEYRIDERFMLEAHVKCENGGGESFTALNDIVISRASYRRMVALDVEVDGHFLASYDGDGVVVATPTGSTAYSMSAGGPVVEPSLGVCVITPICCHTMSSRPMIVPGGSKINIKFRGTFDDMSMLTADGQRGFKLSDGDEITVSASDKTLKLIKISDMGFYELLGKKLHG